MLLKYFYPNITEHNAIVIKISNYINVFNATLALSAWFVAKSIVLMYLFR